jgi:hypothetical protein
LFHGPFILGSTNSSFALAISHQKSVFSSQIKESISFEKWGLENVKNLYFEIGIFQTE